MTDPAYYNDCTQMKPKPIFLHQDIRKGILPPRQFLHDPQTTFANNAGKINKLVMVFALNPGNLTTLCQGRKPTAPVVLRK